MISEKMSCRQSSGGKKHATKFLGKNILRWKKYRSWRIMLKKILDRYTLGKKFLTPERFGKKFSN